MKSKTSALLAMLGGFGLASLNPVTTSNEDWVQNDMFKNWVGPKRKTKLKCQTKVKSSPAKAKSKQAMAKASRRKNRK